jgi:TonB family protein
VAGTSAIWVSARAVETTLAAPFLPSTVVNAVSNSPLSAKLPAFLLAVWLVGFLAVALRLIAGFFRLAWTSAHATPAFDRRCMRLIMESTNRFRLKGSPQVLFAANSHAMPMTWGFLQPVIVLPSEIAEWSDTRLRMVIVHELAHIARHDWLCQICAELFRAFYWFHPLAWFAAARLRQESERACDDSVLATGTLANDYADELLDLARTLKNPHRAWTSALALARPSHLERRFAAMLDSNVNRRRLSRKTKGFAVLFAFALLLPLAALRLPAQDLSGTFGGTVHDPSGAPVANATIIMSDHKTNKTEMTTSGADGTYKFASLPAGDYDMKVVRAGFQEFQRLGISLQSGRDSSQDVTLNLGSVNEEVNVEAKAHESGPKKPAPRIGLGGNVKPPTPITKVQPAYPEKAKSEGVQGSVVLRAVIGIKGDLLSLRVVNSDVNPDLARAAVEAVNQWHYQPVLLNGKPVEVDTNITVNFTLQP